MTTSDVVKTGMDALVVCGSGEEDIHSQRLVRSSWLENLPADSELPRMQLLPAFGRKCRQ